MSEALSMPGPPVSVGCAVLVTPGMAGAPDSGVITAILQSAVTAGGMPLATARLDLPDGQQRHGRAVPARDRQRGRVDRDHDRTGQPLVRIGDQIPSGPGVLTILGPPAAPFVTDGS